jgi:hypothetical protein
VSATAALVAASHGVIASPAGAEVTAFIATANPAAAIAREHAVTMRQFNDG